MPHHAAAIRANAHDIAGNVALQLLLTLRYLIKNFFFSSNTCRGLNFKFIIDQAAFDHARNRIGAGKYPASFFPRRRRTTDRTQLLDNNFNIYAGTKS